MEKAPKVGQRVRYWSDCLIELEGEPRVCTGTVTQIYPHHEDGLDDGESIRSGPLLPEEQWKVAMTVDRPLPKWWPYGECDQFAPNVDELEE